MFFACSSKQAAQKNETHSTGDPRDGAVYSVLFLSSDRCSLRLWKLLSLTHFIPQGRPQEAPRAQLGEATGGGRRRPTSRATARVPTPLHTTPALTMRRYYVIPLVVMVRAGVVWSGVGTLAVALGDSLCVILSSPIPCQPRPKAGGLTSGCIDQSGRI